jgi:hypothetical protein
MYWNPQERLLVSLQDFNKAKIRKNSRDCSPEKKKCFFKRFIVRYYFLCPVDHARAIPAEMKSPAIAVRGDRGIVGVKEATGVT